MIYLLKDCVLNVLPIVSPCLVNDSVLTSPGNVPGKPYRSGRLSTVDLLIKIVCLKIYFQYKKQLVTSLLYLLKY